MARGPIGLTDVALYCRKAKLGLPLKPIVEECKCGKRVTTMLEDSEDPEDIMSEEVVKIVRENTSLGQQQYTKFIEERFVKRENPMTNPLLWNKLALFSNK
ncbi:reverse transcriptase [Plakobranchus ocellatus]|uniref:Reverse transcriptase n=1 Tax=Plakobranchus ocellatus TaxID=259542 RepID=A0AAV3ZJ87_9GAST|nr:reverse transcriptase [Plakobranchus ocellatus]